MNVKHNHHRSTRRIWGLASRLALMAVLLFAAGTILAGTWNKANNTNDMNTAVSWIENSSWPLASTDTAQWNDVAFTTASAALGTNLTWGPLNFTAWGAAFTIINAGHTLTLSGSGITLAAATNLTLNCPVAFGANQIWTVAAGQTITVNGIMSGAFTLTNAGAGTLVFNGANTRTIGTTLTAGKIKLGNILGLGTVAANTNQLNGGTLDLATDLSVSPYLTIVGGTGAVTISPNVATPGAGIAHTLGTLSIGTNQFNVTVGDNVTSGTAQLVFGTTTLTNSPTFDVAGGANLILNGAMVGNFTFTKQGNGQLTLTTASARTSGTPTLTAGTLKLNAVTTALGTTGVALQLNGGTLDLALTNSVNAHPTTVGGNATIISEPLTLLASVTNTLGTLTNGAYTLTVQAGSNVVSGTAGLAFGAVTLTGNATFNVTNIPGSTTLLTLGAVTGGVNTLTKNGTGQLTLNANAGDGWTGGVTLNAGTLSVNTTNALGTGPLTINGGTIASGTNTWTNANPQYWNGDFTFLANTVLNTGTNTVTLGGPGSNRVVTVSGATNVITIGGAIGGGYGLTKAGPGSLSLTNLTGNSYSGTTTNQDGGTLTLNYGGNVSMLSDTAELILNGGTLALTGSSNHTEIVSATTIGPGANTITGTAGARVLQMNTITRNVGGTINFGATSVANTDNNNVNGILGGWATVAAADWAYNSTDGSDGLIQLLPAGSYLSQNACGSWLANSNIVNSGAWSGSVGTLAINSIKCNAAAAGTITITGILTIDSGGILETATVAANLQTITGGTLAGAAGKDLVIHQGTAGNSLTIASVIADNTSATALTKSGVSGTTNTLTGANTYSGGTYLNAGTLNINNATALGNGGTFTINGGIINNSTAATIIMTGNNPQIWNADFTFIGITNLNMGTGAVALGGVGAARIVTVTNTLTVGPINGARGLTKAGAGTLVIGNGGTACSYTGDTTIAAGTLRCGAADVMPNGPGKGDVYLTAATAIFDVNGSNQTINGLFSGVGGVVTNSSSTAATLTVGSNNVSSYCSSSIGGVGGGLALTKTGAGTLILAVANTLTNGIVLNGGTLVGTVAGAFGPVTNTVTFNGGNLELRAAATVYTNMLTMTNSGGTITLNPASLLTGVAHSLGRLTIGSKQLSVVSGANVLNGAGQLTIGATTLTGDPIFDVGPATILVLLALNDGGTARTITKQGGGALTLATAANTLGNNEQVNVRGGTLNVSLLNALGALAVVDLSDGTTLGVGATTTIGALSDTNATALFHTASVSIGSGFTLTVGGTNNLSSTFSGIISNAGALTKAGTGTLTLGGISSNNYLGLTTVSAGTLELGKSNNVNAIVGGGLTISGTNASPPTALVKYTGTSADMIGNSAITNYMLGTLDLNDRSDTVGALTMYGGTLKTGIGTLTLGGNVIYNTTSDNETTAYITGYLDLGGANRFTIAKGVQSEDMVISAVVSGTNTLTKAGSGTLTLSGTNANTYSGLTTVRSGTLRLGKTNNNVNAIVGGGLTISGTNASPLAATVKYTGTSADMIGASPITIYKNGTLDLNGLSDTFGAITMCGGWITNLGAGTLTLGSNVTYNTNSGYETTAYIAGNLGLGANRSFTIADGTQSEDMVISAVVSGPYTFTKAGAGTLTLSGANIYSGKTIISAGTLQIGAGGAAGTLGTGNVSNNAALVFNRSDAITVGNAISGSGSLTQSGAGTLTLSGVNSYVGSTTVSNGTLLVNGSLNGAGQVTATNSGTLGGVGTVAGPVLINTNCTLAPGSNSIGKLTVTNDLTFDGGTFNVKVTTTNSGGYGQVKVTGGDVQINPGSKLTVSGSGYTPGSNDYLWIINNTGGTGSGTFVDLAENGTTNIAGTGFKIHYHADFDTRSITNGNDVLLVNGLARGDQTITSFTPTNGSVFGNTNAVQLFAQASSCLSVTNFALIPGGPGVLDATKTNLTFTGTGTVSVTANQAGDDYWNAAPTLTNTFTVKQVLTITGSFTASDKEYDETTSATISLNSLALVGTNGTEGLTLNAVAVFESASVGVNKLVSLTGSSLGGATAGNYILSLTGAPTALADITQGSQYSQTIINFTPANGSVFAQTSTVGLAAQASSGLTVTNFAVVAGLGEINNLTNLTFTGRGAVSIKASRAGGTNGGTNYFAAPNVTNVYTVVYAATPTTNTIPWSDDFESYTNLTPLVDGINGWYGSSADIIVQNTTFFGGAQAAMIPVDCTLSNRFVSAASTNVWLQMDIKVAQYDGTNVPAVNTNATAMFYINTNGNFVVHNGTTTNAIDSTNWVSLSSDITGQPASSNADGAWVRVNIYQDYAHTNWALFAGHVLLTNNIGFINPGITNFTGFDFYSGYSTTYLDNVFVTTTNPPDLATNGNNWLPGMAVSNLTVTNSVMRGKNATGNSFDVWRTSGYDALYFTNTVSANWLAPNPSSATITNATSRVDIVYSTAGLAAGTFTGLVNVTGYDATFGFIASNAPQTVTVVMNVMDLQVDPAGLTNTVMVGWAPAPQTNRVGNPGGGSFKYTISVTNNWLSCSPTSDTLSAFSTNLFTVTYSNTVGWNPNTTSNTTIQIVTTNDGGVTQTVTVVLNVLGRATNFYVSTNGLSIGPYTNWVTAATNIQDAVNAAISGNNVWVSNGVFTLTNQISVTNGIFIQGVRGRTNTFINGNYPVTTNRCFNVAHSNAVVQGFTISNGCAASGGGVYLSAGAMLRDCVVSGNRATETVSDGGGGIFADSFSTVTNCVIAGNTSAGLAGGLLLDSGGMAFNCWISNNTATSEGGGTVIRSGSAIWNSTIASNRASAAGAQGGGVMLGEGVGDTSTVWNCTLVNNSADIGGGLAAASGRARNCLIHLNSAGILGAGVYMANSSDSAIQNCTISSNSPSSSYGVYSHATAGGYFENNIIVSNSILVATGASIGFTNNCVESTNGLSGSGNITNNPAFINFAGGNFRLSAGSPCNFAGTNQVWMVGATDLDGNPRIMGVSVNMGAYESLISWMVTPGALTNQVMAGRQPTNQPFAIINQGSNTLYYTVSNTAPWVTASSNSGTLGTYETNALVVTYAVTTNWTPGTSNAAVKVVVTNAVSALYPPHTQTVAIVMHIMQLRSEPGGFTNTVMPGYTPPAQTLTLTNAGAGTFDCFVTNDAAWVIPSPTNGTLGSGGTISITLTYGSTTNWQVGTTSNATVTVVSTDGGGATQTVAIVFNVVDLAPPSGVTASKGTYTDKVQVTWTAVTNATGYQVWRHTANETAAATNLSRTADTNYDDTTALQDVTYYYWVKSTNYMGVSGFSDPDTGYRSGGATPAPPAPTGVTATKGTHTDKVTLSWTAAAGAVGYEIWRNTSSATNTASKISSWDVAGTSYNDTDAANAVLYTYWVKTRAASGVVSAFSASDTGWRGLLSPSLSASKGSHREVSVTWSVSAGATSYELWKNTVNESSSAEFLASVSATSYRDMAVTPGPHYYYWVKALCAQGDSGWGASSVGWCGAAKWDFNGDGLAEAWYYHEEGGRWYVMMTTNVLSTAELGGAGWAAVPADYDGDGKTDPAVYNRGDPSTSSGLGGTWKVCFSGNGYELKIITGFGGSGFTAAVGDYDGDGKADPTIYAESLGTWKIAKSGNNYKLETTPGFGEPGYCAVPADYDGDGKTDPAIYEEASGNWRMALSGSGYNVSNVLQFGSSGFVPVPGEYDGRGYAQIAVYHEASGNWFIRTGPGPGEYTKVYFGQLGYVPIPADYDGDRYDDEGVFYRNRYDATWYLLMSTEGRKIIFGRINRP